MARSRAAPATPTRSHAAPPPAHKPTTNQSTASAPQHANQSTAQPQVTNIYVQRGGGGGTGMLGTMAAVAGGSVLGHGISNYLYGGNTQAPTQPAEAQSLAQAASQEGHVCASQLTGYSKCLENNSNSADSCKWAWDYFLQCQKEHPAPQ